MIVGSFHGVDERRRRVAGPDGMTIEEVVRKVLLDEHADLIREAAWRRRCPFHTQLGRALRSKPISRVLLLRRGGERLGARFPDSCSGRRGGVAADQPYAPATASEGEAMNRRSRVRVIKKRLQAGLF
jgi:hypothetical protein